MRSIADKLQSGSLTLSSIYRTLPDDADIENMSFGDIFKTTARELKEHSFNLLGTVSMKDEKEIKAEGKTVIIMNTGCTS